MMEQRFYNRRKFLATSALALTAAQLNIGAADAFVFDGEIKVPKLSADGLTAPWQLKQIDAGLLSVGYGEAGPGDGEPIILLHGWPYDIWSFALVVPLLVAKGYRVLMPYARGFGPTSFRSAQTPRNGQQAALACDVIDFMDALKIDSAIICGFDWGARSANIIASVWPERCKAMVAVSGYIIVDRQLNRMPLPPKAELGWWYQYYFSTERGNAGYRENTYEFNKLIWELASPKWQFDEKTFRNTATSFNNEDHVEIVIHNYRWRLELEPGEARYDDIENQLVQKPAISVPAITIGSDFDGKGADGSAYRKRFSGKYLHKVLHGIGHNVPQEDPSAFAQAVLEAAEMSKN